MHIEARIVAPTRELHSLRPGEISVTGRMTDIIVDRCVRGRGQRQLETRGIAGRRVEDIDVAAYIRVAVVANEEIVHAPLRRQIMRYLNMEYYRNDIVVVSYPH